MELIRFSSWKGKLIIGVVLLLLGGFIWWLLLYVPYRPKAYVGVAEWEFDGRQDVNYSSQILEIDLMSLSVTNTLFVDTDFISKIRALEIDENNNLLYAGGSIGDGIDQRLKDEVLREKGRHSRGVEVYDLETNEKNRRMEIVGNRHISQIQLSGNGEKVFIFPNQKEYRSDLISGIHDVEDGKYIRGFDKIARQREYISSKGDTIYTFLGTKPEYFTFVEYSTVKDERTTHLLKEPERIKERGGMHPDPADSFKLDYPYYVRLSHWEEPIQAYDRDTFEQIDTGPVVTEGLDKEEVGRVSTSVPGMLTKDNRYLVVRYTKSLDQGDGEARWALYFRVIDLEKMEIMGDAKIWEAQYGSTTNVVAY